MEQNKELEIINKILDIFKEYNLTYEEARRICRDTERSAGNVKLSDVSIDTQNELP